MKNSEAAIRDLYRNCLGWGRTLIQVGHEVMITCEEQDYSTLEVIVLVYSQEEWKRTLDTDKVMAWGWVEFNDGFGRPIKSVKPKKAKDLSQAKRWLRTWVRKTFEKPICMY